MERIAGSYAAMSDDEQLAFTIKLREQRRAGAKVRGVKGKVETHEQETEAGQAEQEGVSAETRAEGSGDQD
jgi:hypothetical protein